MEKALTVNAQDGSIRIGGIALVICADLTRTEARRELKAHLKQTDDYEFLYADDITFGRQPARISLCFFNERLEFISLGATPPGREHLPPEANQDAFDAEISFMQTELQKERSALLGKSEQVVFPRRIG